MCGDEVTILCMVESLHSCVGQPAACRRERAAQAVSQLNRKYKLFFLALYFVEVERGSGVEKGLIPLTSKMDGIIEVTPRFVEEISFSGNVFGKFSMDSK